VTSIVFLRGANLGKRRFSPKAVEKALADLGVVNVAAAGTFVVRKRVAAKTLRARIEEELPFEPAPMMIATQAEVVAAIEAGAGIAIAEGARRFATIMERAPAKPKLPVEAPGIVIPRIVGRFALGTRRPMAEHGVYPNEVVERAFDVDATTRDWPTMEMVATLLG